MQMTMIIKIKIENPIIIPCYRNFMYNITNLVWQPCATEEKAAILKNVLIKGGSLHGIN